MRRGHDVPGFNSDNVTGADVFDSKQPAPCYPAAEAFARFRADPRGDHGPTLSCPGWCSVTTRDVTPRRARRRLKARAGHSERNQAGCPYPHPGKLPTDIDEYPWCISHFTATPPICCRSTSGADPCTCTPTCRPDSDPADGGRWRSVPVAEPSTNHPGRGQDHQRRACAWYTRRR